MDVLYVFHSDRNIFGRPVTINAAYAYTGHCLLTLEMFSSGLVVNAPDYEANQIPRGSNVCKIEHWDLRTSPTTVGSGLKYNFKQNAQLQKHELLCVFFYKES